MNEVRPKKSLGQHFLTDQNIAQRIVEQLSPDVESVIEVGAGTGVLTQYMVQDILDKFHVIEIDKESIAYLQKHFPMLGERLIEGDFLRTDLSQFGQQNMAIIGNFPYNISSQIFFQVLKYKEQVVEVVGMVQKEMAERMAAKEGSKTYGILSVLMQAWYDIDYLFTVHENVFNPPPKVKSAVIKMRRNAVTDLGCDEKLFVTIWVATRSCLSASSSRPSTSAARPCATHCARCSVPTSSTTRSSTNGLNSFLYRSLLT